MDKFARMSGARSDVGVRNNRIRMDVKIKAIEDAVKDLEHKVTAHHEAQKSLKVKAAIQYKNIEDGVKILMKTDNELIARVTEIEKKLSLKDDDKELQRNKYKVIPARKSD